MSGKTLKRMFRENYLYIEHIRNKAVASTRESAVRPCRRINRISSKIPLTFEKHPFVFRHLNRALPSEFWHWVEDTLFFNIRTDDIHKQAVFSLEIGLIFSDAWHQERRNRPGHPACNLDFTAVFFSGKNGLQTLLEKYFCRFAQNSLF